MLRSSRLPSGLLPVKKLVVTKVQGPGVAGRKVERTMVTTPNVGVCLSVEVTDGHSGNPVQKENNLNHSQEPVPCRSSVDDKVGPFPLPLFFGLRSTAVSTKNRNGRGSNIRSSSEVVTTP